MDSAQLSSDGIGRQQAHPGAGLGILIAIDDPHVREFWRQGLAETAYRVDGVGGWRETLEYLGRHPVGVVVLDSRWLDVDMAESLSALARVQPTCHVLVEGHGWPERQRIIAFALGVRGYCDRAADPASCRSAVESIVAGEVWINRALIPKIIDYIKGGAASEPSANEEKRRIQGKLALLTAREWEVVRLISVGNGNKAVARFLRITERTVKAHLTAIFRKLGVEDRMHLALMFKEAERHGLVVTKGEAG